MLPHVWGSDQVHEGGAVGIGIIIRQSLQTTKGKAEKVSHAEGIPDGYRLTSSLTSPVCAAERSRGGLHVPQCSWTEPSGSLWQWTL